MLIAVGVVAVPPVGTGQVLPKAAVPARGTNAPADTAGSEASVRAIESRLNEARTSLTSAASGEPVATNLPTGIPQAELRIRRAMRQRLVSLLEQQLSFASEIETTRT